MLDLRRLRLLHELHERGTIAAVAEALTLARRAGVDPEPVREALQGGCADSRILRVHGRRMLEGAFAPGFRIRLQAKDARVALDLAASVNLQLPVTSLVSPAAPAAH